MRARVCVCGSEQVEVRFQLMPLTLFRCVRSCAHRGALRAAKLRLWETVQCHSVRDGGSGTGGVDGFGHVRLLSVTRGAKGIVAHFEQYPYHTPQLVSVSDEGNKCLDC